MMIRTFIALELPDEVKEKILSIRNEFYPFDGKVKWEPKSKLHLTLKFLGDTDENNVDTIWDYVLRIIKTNQPFQMTFNGFGIFRRDVQPKIFWAGFEKNKFIEKLADEINAECQKFGFPAEKRKFNPHLTLLRIRGNEKIDLLYKIVNTKFEPIDFIANTIILYKSELKPSGSEYTVLKKFIIKKEKQNVE